MSKLLLSSGYLLFILSFEAVGQTMAVKHVAANGGSLKVNTAYSSVSVIGEMAVGSFSIGVLSGPVGYIDKEDLSAAENVSTPSIPYQIIVFPNPNRGNFQVSILGHDTATAKFVLMDILGRIVQSRTERLLPRENYFNFFNITAGVWLLEIIIEEKLIKTEKVLVR